MPPKKKPKLIKTKTFAYRFIATFFASAFSVIGLGSILGIDLLKSALFAGVIGIVNLVELLARAYLKDGQLTMREINYAFNHYDSDNEEISSGYNCHCTKCCPNS